MCFGQFDLNVQSELSKFALQFSKHLMQHVSLHLPLFWRHPIHFSCFTLRRLSLAFKYYKYLKVYFIHSVDGDGPKTAQIIKNVILLTITSRECQRIAK